MSLGQWNYSNEITDAFNNQDIQKINSIFEMLNAGKDVDERVTPFDYTIAGGDTQETQFLLENGFQPEGRHLFLAVMQDVKK